MRTGRIDRYSSFTTEIVSWRSTMVALIWAFRWIAAASMAHPDLRLCPQKRLLNGYQMPRVKRLATGVTAAERKRRQRNLFPHLKIFLQKRPPQKGYPLSGENRFWTGFWERGHEQFSESKSPSYRGVASAARTSKLGDAPNRASSDPRCRRQAPNLR